MAASPPPPSEGEIIEHVVLFNISDDEDEYDHQQDHDHHHHHPSKVNATITALTTLHSAALLHLSAGPILRTRSLLPFSHLLHSRLLSRAPHVPLLPSSSSDAISLTWSGPAQPTSIRAGSGLRFTFLKVEDPEEIEKVLEGLGRIKESLSPFVQLSYGENLTDDEGKGFSVAALAVFPDLNELDASEEFEDEIRSLIHKFRIPDDAIVAVDYVVPRLSPVITGYTVE